MKELQVDPRTLTELAPWSVKLGEARVTYGEGALAGLGEAARELGCRSVLLVTDGGLRAAGHVAAAEASLTAASVRVTIFDAIGENPTTAQVEHGRREAAAAGIDGLIGLGGGSALDAAKGINFLHTNGGRMEDYWGRGKARRPMLPSIGVPTTAGTGSEAQSFALISQADTGVKMACGDPKAHFRTVILDPATLATVPRRVRAISGIDAVVHAVESFVTTERNAISQLFAREAWRLLASNLESILAPGTVEPAVRGRMLLGAFFAGMAIEHSMLGAAHACANPLTTSHDVTHGIAVGLMLPHVVRFNGVEIGPLYDELRLAAGPAGGADLEQRVRQLHAAGGLPQRLRDCGVPADGLDDLAEQASQQWTAAFNPRRVTYKELLGLYEAAY